MPTFREWMCMGGGVILGLLTGGLFEGFWLGLVMTCFAAFFGTLFLLMATHK